VLLHSVHENRIQKWYKYHDIFVSINFIPSEGK
jgi:hypothetical protein